MKTVSDLVINGLGDIDIFGALGNHDAYPQDMIRVHPFYNDATSEWSPIWNKFIPDADQKQNFNNYGYYTKEVDASKF